MKPAPPRPPLQAAIRSCRVRVRRRKAETHALFWSGTPGSCDGCGHSLIPEVAFFADIRISRSEGIWGLLCPVCLVGGGHTIGWGHGQLYEYQSDSQHWLLVAGFMPTSPSPGF